MDILVVFSRMLMLLAMMSLGFIAYKIKWMDDNGYEKLSKIVVNIFNPALVINGAISATGGADGKLVKENIMFVCIYFLVLIVLSYPIALAIRTKKSHRNIYQLMTIYSNVGFMGIPVISSILGPESVIYVTFYVLAYNLLLYTFGSYLAQINIPKENRVSGVKGLLNPGVICSALAIILYALGVKCPETVLTFFDYVGNATIPLSMFVIGVSVAKMPVSEIFGGARIYIFSVIKLLVIPILATFVFAGLRDNDMIFSIFILMFAMPVGSIVTMLVKEYGASEALCSRGIIITTVASIITIPIVAMFI